MIDSAEGRCTVLHSTDRKARKEHRCTECYRVIPVGEIYLNEGCLWDGRKDTYKICSHCQVVRNWLSAECGGWLYEGVREDIYEHAFEGNYGKGVIMLSVGMGRQWKKKNGDMWRVPSLPKTTHQRMAVSV
jgi:hypothetical protein